MDADETDVSTSSEFAAAAITCSCLRKPLIVGSIYRPSDNIIVYSDELYTDITTLHQRYKEHTVNISGGAYLPDIDWTSDTLSSNSYAIPTSSGFSEVLQDVGSQQMLNFPTRKNNTLDIFCTNRPSLVQRCVPIPGLNDHDMVLVDSNFLHTR